MKIKELLDYKEGKLYWKVKPSKKVRIGDRAGSGNTLYRYIRINGVGYREHTIVWLWHTGKFPKNEIDHINGNKLDNRIENLRDVTRNVNAKNIRKPTHNTSGFVGVQLDKKRNLWYSVIEVNNKRKRLGFYTDIEEAISARLCAESVYGFHRNHGRTI